MDVLLLYVFIGPGEAGRYRQVAALYSGPPGQVAGLIRQVPLYTLCSPIYRQVHGVQWSH